MVVTLACTHTRFNAHRRARAPLHLRPLGEGRAFDPVHPYTEAVDPLVALPLLLRRGCLSARARRVKVEPLGYLA
jgi:hypothetical protein